MKLKCKNEPFETEEITVKDYLLSGWYGIPTDWPDQGDTMFYSKTLWKLISE